MAKDDIIKNLEQKVQELELEKTQLLKLVSHDVKSPFNKLYALSNLLQLVSEDLNEEQLDYLTRMEWVIKEGLTVVRNLMDLRAIDNNNIDLNIEELRLDLILTDTIRGYSKQSNAKQITVETKTDNITTWSDKRLVERVFDHLVSNAIKFTPKEEPVLVKLSKNGPLIRLEVSSKSGPLLSEEVANLFKKSSPLSTRPTHGESALGNGLFIAKKNAEALSGNIVFSQNKKECKFTFELPQKES